MSTFRTLRLILGDQLNVRHSWFQTTDPEIVYVMMEMRSETDYVRHHIQKVIGFFLAMRSFAAQLEEQGHTVRYMQLDDPENRQSVSKNIRFLIEALEIEHFEYLLPDEYRLDEELRSLCEELPVTFNAWDTEHFLAEREAVAKFFEGKKTYLLESFYREMRRRHEILMEADGKTPLTGRWNYDEENRKKLPARKDLPAHPEYPRKVNKLVAMLEKAGIETIGQVDPDHYTWPVTRAECLDLLDHFCRHRLAEFGTYQDAMSTRDTLLFHSKLSFALNVKLLHPREVVDACLQHWETNDKAIGIAQIEGFVRQVIGWREYLRGIYWAEMPDYRSLNFFDHQAPLPSFFWTGKTRMNCLHHAIGQSLDLAYAHHIQRLMVTGNFALLLGVHPDAVDEWYLGIYMDAVEWVEITNTRGMSQFADGGVVGTKPYVSSANYIHKMSDYCAGCHYDRKQKYGSQACPFNSLYWDFYDRHADKLKNNPRVGMMYRVWERMDPEEREKILRQAAYYREHAEEL